MIKYFIPRTDPVDESGKIDAKAMEAIRGGWYLGEQGFKDKILGLIGKAGAKIRDRGNLAGAALRAHDENEAERIIRIVGAVMELPGSGAELELLRKGDSRRVMCAATVKRRTSVKNDWLASRLRMGHPAAMSQLVSRNLKDPKRQKNLKEYNKIFHSKD